MPKPRSGTSYRLSEDAQALLGRLTARLGLTKTGVLEMAIRKLAYTELDKAGGEPRPAATVSREEEQAVHGQAQRL
jgi:hypothetical protein